MPRSVHREHDRLAAIAEAQDNVVSRADLGSLGWNHDHIHSAVSARRWRTQGQRAVVLHSGPLTRRQRWWIALVNAGPQAALAGLTAAEEQGFSGFRVEPVHILLPKGVAPPRDRDGVVVHQSRRFGDEDRHPGRLIPTVRIERALIDAAVFTPNGRRASAILISGVQQRLTSPERLRQTLLDQGMVRHRKLLLRVLRDVEGGVHALSELDFARLCRRNRLPIPIRQQKRVDERGRVRYLDARFELADGRAVNVEIDGAAHLDVADAWADAERDLALLTRGEPTVRIPAALLRSDPTGVAQRLRRLLRP